MLVYPPVRRCGVRLGLSLNLSFVFDVFIFLPIKRWDHFFGCLAGQVVSGHFRPGAAEAGFLDTGCWRCGVGFGCSG